MKPILIIGVQVIAFIIMLYLTSYVAYALTGHWTVLPTFVLCFLGCLVLLLTTALTIQSYLPGPKQ